MLHVVGGTYFESCAEPERKELLGSGLRGAAAVCSLTRVKLHTYISEQTRDLANAVAATLKVPLAAHSSRSSIRFDYAHPLAVPTISPSKESIPREDAIVLTADAALCYGMLEGSVRLRAKRAVYDPQSPSSPNLIDTGQIEALALVLNGREASLLAGTHTKKLDEVAKRLIAKSGAKVVVIKRGTHGASVFTDRRATTVPAYQTSRVWKIGSGDVFAAVFARYWALGVAEPHVAAQMASKAVASYCDSHSLPVPKNFGAQFAPLKLKRLKRRPRVYLAGPFFTMAQRWLINEARRALQEQGLDVFSPLHDVGHGTAELVVPADLKALRRSDVVFAIADGLDSGTLYEVGYACARRIPVIAFVQNEDSNALKMLEGSACQLVDDFTTAIYRTAWKAVAE